MPLATVDQFVARLRGGSLVAPDRLKEVVEALQRERAGYNSRQLAARLIEAGLLTPEVAAALLEGSTILTMASEPPGVNLSQAQVDDGSTLRSGLAGTRPSKPEPPKSTPGPRAEAIPIHAEDSIFDVPEGVVAHSSGEDSIFDVPEQVRAKTGDTFLGMSGTPAKAMEISVGNLDDDGMLEVLTGDMQLGQQLRETPTMVGRLSQIGNVRVELFTSEEAGGNAISQVPPEKNASLMEVLTDPPLPAAAAPLAQAFAAPPPPARKGPVIPNQLLDEDDRTVATSDPAKPQRPPVVGPVAVQVTNPPAEAYVPGKHASLPASAAPTAKAPAPAAKAPVAAVPAKAPALPPSAVRPPVAAPAVAPPVAAAADDSASAVQGDFASRAARQVAEPGLSEIHTSLPELGPAEAAPQAASFGFDAGAMTSVASEPYSFGFVADDTSPLLFSTATDGWPNAAPAVEAPAEPPVAHQTPDADAGVAAATPSDDEFAALAGELEPMDQGTPTALGRMSQIGRTAGLVELETPDETPAARIPTDDPHDFDPEDLSGIGPVLAPPRTPAWSPWAQQAPAAPPAAPLPTPFPPAASPAPAKSPAKKSQPEQTPEPPHSLAAQGEPEPSDELAAEMALGEDSLYEPIENVWQPPIPEPASAADPLADPLAEGPSVAVEAPAEAEGEEGQWLGEPLWTEESVQADVPPGSVSEEPQWAETEVDEMSIPMPIPSATPTLNAGPDDTLLQVPPDAPDVSAVAAPGWAPAWQPPEQEAAVAVPPPGWEPPGVLPDDEPSVAIPPPGWEPGAQAESLQPPAPAGHDPWRDMSWEGHAPPPAGEEPPLLPPPKSMTVKEEEPEEVPVAPMELAVLLAPRRSAPEAVPETAPPPAQWFEPPPADDLVDDGPPRAEFSLGAKIGVVITLLALLGMAATTGVGLAMGLWASGAWPMEILLILGAGGVLCLAILVAVRPGEPTPVGPPQIPTTTQTPSAG